MADVDEAEAGRELLVGEVDDEEQLARVASSTAPKSAVRRIGLRQGDGATDPEESMGGVLH